ncbi:acyl-CoA desaturase [Marinifilum caeruleilacunae]|uniref:Acyl-CoA desaturase n=1 Tax=Marinifilum caeruleilacunae TaxID=2499076 RepID=A0ABX1WZ39_9BACT|nr:acyl-CoA desaturase [Marinifilum caeruleilacunae]NOU61186.1 acyl-CoA desaturase [Marinifilum caeruleilacunae]
MIILVFILLHWYASLFFQTVFLHRYAAHSMFKMNRFWEKAFFIATWIAQGTSYLNPFAYAYMHRIHHMHAENEKDPHSPEHSGNIFSFMLKTYDYYAKIKNRDLAIEKELSMRIPRWEKFEKISESWLSRLMWAGVYIAIYILYAPNIYFFFLLPVHFFMSPIHGAIINWFSHKIGYKNFKQDNHSTNLFPIEIFLGGEALHNNHHAQPWKANFARRWFEFDPSYVIMRMMHALKIITIHKNALK